MNNGLNHVTKNCVHFARGLSRNNGVISGICSDCEVLIYLDVQNTL
jgi:RNA:NAD 2'-phosphotransferase (TPT1/KptA family)